MPVSPSLESSFDFVLHYRSVIVCILTNKTDLHTPPYHGAGDYALSC